jgi:RNA polymerase sigma-70 factor (family 1)
LKPAEEAYELLQQIAEGSPAAFEVVYKQYFVRIYHYALGYVQDSQSAEDITTEVFLKLWERFSQFTTLEGLQAFLFTAARNASLNHNRGEGRAEVRHQEFMRIVTGTDDPMEEEGVKGQVYQAIYEAIENLPAQEKKAFKLAYLEGQDNEAISKLMGITNQSVRNHKARALKTLRMVLLSKNFEAWIVLFLFIERNK